MTSDEDWRKNFKNGLVDPFGWVSGTKNSETTTKTARALRIVGSIFGLFLGIAGLAAASRRVAGWRRKSAELKQSGKSATAADYLKYEFTGDVQ